MRLITVYIRTVCIFSLFLLTTGIVSCEKDYSYEGGGDGSPVIINPEDTAHHTDTTVIDPAAVHDCNTCDETHGVLTGTWSFVTGSSFVCGEIDTAFVLNHERTMLTFFGPSFCGADSGLIFTVYLPAGLDRDRINLQASSTAFYYYRTAHPYILMPDPSNPFHLTFTSYNHSTRIASGIFSGVAIQQDGVKVAVTNGKFSCEIR